MERLITRKEFIKSMGACASVLFLGCPGKALFAAETSKNIKGTVFKGDAPDKPWKWSIEAFYYKKIGKDTMCLLCPNHCYLRPGDRSVCR